MKTAVISGYITQWHDDKGYGFIQPASSATGVFFHINDLRDKRTRPQINDKVRFQLNYDKQGRAMATQIRLKTSRRRISIPVLLSSSFLIVLTVQAWFSLPSLSTPIWTLLVYLLMSTLTFSIYAWDKRAAQNGGWRTKESSLHLLALCGGWPGALVAQQQFRHKSRKQPFKFILWCTVLSNLGAYISMFTPLTSDYLLPLLQSL